jgi:DNA-binding NarL/FixJ family response regulator
LPAFIAVAPHTEQVPTSGGKRMSNNLSRRIQVLSAAWVNPVSKRELEVVRGLCEGLTNREIAERLGVSQHTVKNYLFRLLDKLPRS